MGNFEESFYEAITKWLKSRDVDAEKVVSVEQDTQVLGYCETCEYTQIIVNISYNDSEGFSQLYEYFGSMAEMINDLA